jgi:hypothetical protein
MLWLYSSVQPSNLERLAQAWRIEETILCFSSTLNLKSGQDTLIAATAFPV